MTDYETIRERAEAAKTELDEHPMWPVRFMCSPTEMIALLDENRALRESLIHAVDLRRLSHENERQLWAIREAANHGAKPFSHDWVQEKYDRYPSAAEQIAAVEKQLSDQTRLAAFLANELAEMKKARDEACNLAEEYLYGRNTVVTYEREARIAALRAVGEPSKGST